MKDDPRITKVGKFIRKTSIDELPQLLNIIAVAESTPGPIAVNMATYVGSTQGGILGSILATLGAITPSVIIILIIAGLLKNFLKYKGVRWALNGMKPVICGMILATGATLMLSNVLPNIEGLSFSGFSLSALIITVVIAGLAFGYKRWKKKNLSPILIIVISAVLGVVLL